MMTRLKLASALLLLLGAATQAYAGVTLLLEEPYSYDGTFGGTGHAAVYVSRICAESPLILRRCAPGELGVVISRYDNIAAHDWLAIPLIPYLYAVDNPENVPLSADAKLADFLRDQYRRAHLQSIAADGPEGQTPGGRWAELLGADYRRTIYGFELDTIEAQDDALIRKYNADPNRTRFNLVTHNCADFARDLINFYFPKTLHRSVLGDLGVTTPKHIAKLFVRFGERHPELHLSSFVIPQLPGDIRRSAPVHGIAEAVLKAKKYALPLLVLHPLLTSCLFVAAVGGDRFNPARDVMIFDPSRDLEPPMAAAQRRVYQNQLNSLRRPLAEGNSWKEADWRRLPVDSVPRMDSSGNPVLQIELGDKTVYLGLARSNILLSSAPSELVESMVLIRLRDELRSGGSPKASERDVANDWELLQRILLAQRRKVEGDLRLTATRFNSP
jgi:hypothetical protein